MRLESGLRVDDDEDCSSIETEKLVKSAQLSHSWIPSFLSKWFSRLPMRSNCWHSLVTQKISSRLGKMARMCQGEKISEQVIFFTETSREVKGVKQWISVCLSSSHKSQDNGFTDDFTVSFSFLWQRDREKWKNLKEREQMKIPTGIFTRELHPSLIVVTGKSEKKKFSSEVRRQCDTMTRLVRH